MNIIELIGGIFKPATDLIDNLHTSEEEKLEAKTKLAKIENTFILKLLEYENKLTEAQSKVIVAEAGGQSWLQRNWRPITMIVFLVLIICDCFGILVFRLSSEAWTLLKIGLGGYVVGRSAEKVIKTYKK